MKYDELIGLIDRLDQSSLAYVEYVSDQERVVLAKEVPHQVEQTVQPESPQPVAPAPINPPAEAEPAAAAPASAASSPSVETVKSPMVGVAYLQSQPDAPPFVQVGDTVQAGDVVLIIEAMKLMNEIQSTVTGTVTKILVNNEDIVEYNQALIEIEPA